MSQYPPPPPYGYGAYPPPPPGYGYPPPYGMPPQAPPPPPSAPTPPPKSRRARLLDALTILFEIIFVLLVLAYVLARVSGNEEHNWINRVQAAQQLRRAALQAERTQLAAVAAAGQEGGPVVRSSLRLDAAAWLTTLESILDEQAALEAATDDARKALRAEALKHLAMAAPAGNPAAKPNSTATGYAALMTALAAALNADTPTPAAAITPLLKESAAPLKRLAALQPAGGATFDRLPELSPAAAAFAPRRTALRSLMILLAARARLPLAAAGDSDDLPPGGRARPTDDRRLMVTLAAIYLHAWLPADLETAHGATPADAEAVLQLCVRSINQASVAAANSPTVSGAADTAGRLAGVLEQALPAPADLADRLIARLIADHLAAWRQGRSTALWAGEAAPTVGDWTGTDPCGVSANALLTLSANLHAIDGRPVTAEVAIRNADGSQTTLTVAAWLARLNAAAVEPQTVGPDGPLLVGGCNLAACVSTLDRNLRIARAQLHLLQINAQLHDAYNKTQTVLPQLDDRPIDPLTGRPYVYKPYENEWSLLSDFGEDDPAATPNQPDDPRKDMKATLREGLVLR